MLLLKKYSAEAALRLHFGPIKGSDHIQKKIAHFSALVCLSSLCKGS